MERIKIDYRRTVYQNGAGVAVLFDGQYASDGRTERGAVKSLLRQINQNLKDAAIYNPAMVEHLQEKRQACLDWLKENGA
jgi:hypothetical protein